MKTTNSLRKDQTGLVAITVTIFVILVLTLVVLAFSQIARREQRQALDRQLSTQAFYVAESGINDATNFIRTNALPLEKKKCSDAPALSPALDTDGIFRESCVLFDRAPTSIEYSSVDDYNGEFISLKTATGTPRTVTFEWHDSKGGSDFSKCATAGFLSYPKMGSNPGEYSDGCAASMLKVVFMPVNSGSINREELVDASYAMYLRPVAPPLASGNPTYQRHDSGADNQGFVVPAGCDTTSGKCKATINFPAFGGLFLRFSSIYNPSTLSITGKDVGGTAVRFTEAQASIDSTGKTNDVLKRMQVRVPLSPHTQTAPYVLESMNGICKLLGVYPAVGANPPGAVDGGCNSNSL